MGKTKQLIDDLIEQRCKGNSFLETSTRFKLLLKGIDTDKITEDTPDNPKIIEKIYELANNLNIKLA